MATDIDPVGIVGAWLPLLGHVEDLSGNGYDGVIKSPAATDWANVGGVLSYICGRSGNTGAIQLPGNFQLNVQDACTLVFRRPESAYLSPSAWGSGLYGKTGNADFQYDATTKDVQVWAGGVNKVFAPVINLYDEFQTIAFSKASGLARVRAFLDGVYSTQTTTDVQFSDTVSTPYIGQRGIGSGYPTLDGVCAFLLYNVTKTDAQILEISDYLRSLTTPRIGTKHFLPGGLHPITAGDFGQSIAHTEALGIGDTIDPGLDMKIKFSGTAKPIAEEVNGEITKRIETVTDNVYSFWSDGEIGNGYGTWELQGYRKAGATITWFVCCELKPSVGILDGYGVYANSIKEILLYRVIGGVVTTIFTSAVVLTDDAEFRLRMTRDHAGVFRFYLDGVYIGTVTNNLLTSGSFNRFYVSLHGCKISIDSERHTNQLFHLKDVVAP